MSGEFGVQAQLTTPVGTNVRFFEALTRRGRGGSRPGLVRYPDDAMPGLIQHLNYIVDPSADALAIDRELVGWYAFRYVLFADPSTNNLRRRYPLHTVRYVRRGGWAMALNRNKPGPNKKTPTINWSDPADQPVGSPSAVYTITGTQLNAAAVDPVTSASVAGTYLYSPPQDTNVQVGTYTLRVRFTPTNLTTYTIAEKTVTFNVTYSPEPIVNTATGNGICSDIQNLADPANSIITITSVQLSLDSGPLQDYADITCGPDPNLQHDAVFVGANVAVNWYPDNPGVSTFPSGGTFYWSFIGS